MNIHEAFRHVIVVDCPGSDALNVAEGIVIRSDTVVNREALDAGTAFVPQRLLVKRKHPRFQEDVQEIEVTFSAKDAARSYRFVFARLVNANRLAAVLSKTFGRITGDNTEAVVEALEADVWEDFFANPSQCFIADEAAAGDYLKKLCQECVRLASACDATH